ncbi:MAG: 50S ribosomal protein L25/general stress protein Ctc [Hyphomonas sp.]|jgi:large subunit ribosomal protein L25|nr:50S ribosomal protein L25/general stress protein Ctc [Henriciella sp.]MBO6696324.1 50S ribosomal protein L25/general stress protein Ctc [Henriciella sp.]MCH9750865.1 50S ribosomal protein L25/general stress protein Ctc [Alphaproteobacteria bacterium]MCR9223908.1 50S ribosomal protein L25/general stress protein Ctc [Hyphomonas sp.]
MSKDIVFNVDVRERIGKGGAREARRQGFVPGVLYGGGEDPVALNLKQNEVVKAINTGQFLSSTATLVHDGKKQLVIPQAIQMHPVTDQPQHVDLYRVKKDQIITVEVVVNFLNEEASPGLKKGGALNVVRHAVELNVRADAIPDSLDADLTDLDIGDNVKISNIALPDGAEPTITDRDFTIASIVGRGIAADVEEGEEDEAPEAGEVEATKQGGDEDGAAEE